MSQHNKTDMNTLAEKLLPNAALQSVMEYPIATTSHGATVYAVPQGWENEELKTDVMLKKVVDSLTFEAALQANQSKSFYIPNDAALTLELIRKILERNGSTAAVFFEQANGSPSA